MTEQQKQAIIESGKQYFRVLYVKKLSPLGWLN